MSKTRSTGLNRARELTNDEIIHILEEKIKQFTDKEVKKVTDIGSFELMSREDEFELNEDEFEVYEDEFDDDDEDKPE